MDALLTGSVYLLAGARELRTTRLLRIVGRLTMSKEPASMYKGVRFTQKRQGQCGTIPQP